MWWCSEDENYWIDLTEVATLWVTRYNKPKVDSVSIRLRCTAPSMIGDTDMSEIKLNDEDAISFFQCWKEYVKCKQFRIARS